MANTVADYNTLLKVLVSLLKRFEFENANCSTLWNMWQAGTESIAAYAARTTDLFTRA